MKSIELRRHAEKDPNGLLTKAGMEAAIKLGKKLPASSIVIASGSKRAQHTAKLITGIEPEVDQRASMHMASADISEAINEFATKHDISFLEAIYKYGDLPTIRSTEQRADEFNELIDSVFSKLEADGFGLIISHDLSISAALAKRGVPIELITPLEGYVLYENGDIVSITVE